MHSFGVMCSDIFYGNIILSGEWLSDKTERPSLSYFKVNGCPNGPIIRDDEKPETSDISELLKVAYDLSGDSRFCLSTDLLVTLSLDDFIKILKSSSLMS